MKKKIIAELIYIVVCVILFCFTGTILNIIDTMITNDTSYFFTIAILAIFYGFWLPFLIICSICSIDEILKEKKKWEIRK